MTVPDYQTLMLPLLRHAADRNGETHIGALVEEIAKELGLTAEDMSALIPSGGQTLLLNRLHWAKSYMQRAGLIESTRHGYFKVTPRGHDLLRQGPSRIDNSILSRFPEFVVGESVALFPRPQVRPPHRRKVLFLMKVVLKIKSWAAIEEFKTRWPQT